MTLMQVKAFARQDGIVLAVVWLVAMWMLIHHPQSSWGGILVISTPFFIGWRLKSFREKILGGTISFRRGLCFSCYIFFYASIIFALGQFVYFQYLDNGAFITAVREGIETLRPYYEQNHLGTEELELSGELLGTIAPRDLVLTFMMYNLFIGLVVSMLLALIYKKK